MGITHGWTSAATPDGSDVTPTNMNDHTIASDTVTEAMLSISDNTTKDATPSIHGLAPKVLMAHPMPLDSYAIDATYGDDFTAGSLSGSWTRRNFVSGNETYQVGKATTYLRLACSARAAGDAYFRTAPSGDWTFAVAFIPRFYGGLGPAFGVQVVDTNGTGVAFNLYNTPLAFMVYGVTTYTTYGGSFVEVGGGTSSQYGNPYQFNEHKWWLALRKSGTNYYGSYSMDGEAWSPESAAFAWAGTVDRVGMGFGPLGNVTGVNATIDVDWFNRLA